MPAQAAAADAMYTHVRSVILNVWWLKQLKSDLKLHKSVEIRVV